MFIELIKFFILSLLIVLIAKYVLVKVLRNLAQILNLKPKTVGNIAGIATSIPELLTVSFSAFTGFIETSIFNILSSNIINLFQYLISVFINKNQSKLKNNAIKIDLFLVIITIIIPIFIIIFNIESSFILVPIFIILLLFFYKISANAHKIYLKHEKEKSEVINKQKKSVFLNILGIILSGVALYYIGNLLSDTLKILCINLDVPEFVIGILLGIITSIPELITFFESQKHHKKKENHEGIVETTSNLLFSNFINLFIIQSLGIIIFYIFA